MQKFLILFGLVVLGCLLRMERAVADELVITNARILVEHETLIERGTLVARDGRIVSISGDARAVPAGQPVIDARGLTLMPGLIDTHVHLIGGADPDGWLRDRAAPVMQAYLDAGFTTLMSAGDPVPQIVVLQQRIESGQMRGPRLITSAVVDAGDGAEAARLAVSVAAKSGVNQIKSFRNDSKDLAEQKTLGVIVAAARQAGLPTVVHAVGVAETTDLLDLGIARLAHTPHRGWLEDKDIKRIAAAKIPMSSTLGVFVPVFDKENNPRGLGYYGGKPYPMASLTSAGQGPVNARRLWDAGVVYAFGTDSSLPPQEALSHELLPLQLVFSPRDIVRMLTSNAAAFLSLSEELGTLMPGKRADMVLVGGEPLRNPADLLDVKLVIRGGKVVADHR